MLRWSSTMRIFAIGFSGAAPSVVLCALLEPRGDAREIVRGEGIRRLRLRTELQRVAARHVVQASGGPGLVQAHPELGLRDVARAGRDDGRKQAARVRRDALGHALPAG